MIILGEKHKFRDFELKQLKYKFETIIQIRYRNRDEKRVVTEIESAIKKNPATLLILNTQAKVGDELLKYLTNLHVKQHHKQLRIITIESFMEQYFCKCYIPSSQRELNFIEDITPFGLGSYIFKRSIDFLGAFSLGLLSSPIMLYSIYKIKKESPGPVLFRQKRVGKDEKEFTCYKFRSMHVDSYHDPYTRENDSRIFPYGAFMRKTRIDELPQLLNIFKAEMHLVGPRAEWNILVDNYEKEIPYYHSRHVVAPGITGWAQVNYPYGQNIEDTKQKLMYDLYYIKNWSVGLELKTILKTILVVLGKKGL